MWYTPMYFGITSTNTPKRSKKNMLKPNLGTIPTKISQNAEFKHWIKKKHPRWKKRETSKFQTPAAPFFSHPSTQSFHQETQISVENALPTLRVKGHCQPTRLAAAKWHEPRSREENQPMEKQPKKSFWANFWKIPINIINDILGEIPLLNNQFGVASPEAAIICPGPWGIFSSRVEVLDAEKKTIKNRDFEDLHSCFWMCLCLKQPDNCNNSNNNNNKND